jgi:hypothetical protein
MSTPLTATASDSLNNWSDAITVGTLVIAKALSDTLSMSDALVLSMKLGISLEDAIAFADSLRAVYTTRVEAGESFSLSDLLAFSKSNITAFTESMTQSDGISLQMSVNLEVQLSDVMSQSDSLGSMNSTDLINYYRRYLGDVTR